MLFFVLSSDHAARRNRIDEARSAVPPVRLERYSPLEKRRVLRRPSAHIRPLAVPLPQLPRALLPPLRSSARYGPSARINRVDLWSRKALWSHTYGHLWPFKHSSKRLIGSVPPVPASPVPDNRSPETLVRDARPDPSMCAIPESPDGRRLRTRLSGIPRHR